MTWVSLKDKLPNENEWIILTDGEKHWLGMLDTPLNKKFFCKCCLEDLYGVTHWMPTPKLPEVNK